MTPGDAVHLRPYHYTGRSTNRTRAAKRLHVVKSVEGSAVTLMCGRRYFASELVVVAKGKTCGGCWQEIRREEKKCGY